MLRFHDHRGRDTDMTEDWRYRREPDGLGFKEYVLIAGVVLSLGSTAVGAAVFVLTRLI